MYILSPHAAEILYAPPFYTPPTPRTVFSGVGGWGRIKFGPATKLNSVQTRGIVKASGFISLRKGFLQSEALGEVYILEGGSLARSFWRSLGRSFRACFAGTFRAPQKNFSKNFSPLHSKTGENSGKNLMTRFCRGTPANHKGYL